MKSVALCSMDDPALYGETLFTRNFGWAVENGLLPDYKVVVLAVNEADVSASIQRRLSDENNELMLDDATKIIGCYKALLKSDFRDRHGRRSQSGPTGHRLRPEHRGVQAGPGRVRRGGPGLARSRRGGSRGLTRCRRSTAKSCMWMAPSTPSPAMPGYLG